MRITEQRLREEYLLSNYPSGSKGYRDFFVDRIDQLEKRDNAFTEIGQKLLAAHKQSVVDWEAFRRLEALLPED